jgi:hypothetical protein
MFEIREHFRNSDRGNGYTVLADGFTSREDAERELTQMIVKDFDMIEIAEVINLKIDKEAAGYLVDLLNAQIGGRATIDREPLGRVRMALDSVRFSEGPDAFSRQYLVSHPSDQPYPNLARSDDSAAWKAYNGYSE